MAIFDNDAEKKRKDGLATLEDKRVAFAEKLAAMKIACQEALYAQFNGGFHGIGLCGDQIVYLTGPGPMDEGEFTIDVYPSVSIRTEEIYIKPEGIGGLLGFGKKGGSGFRFDLTFPDGETGTIELVSGQNCYYEHKTGADPHFSTKRRRGNANVVWDYKAADAKAYKDVMERWLKKLGDEL